MNFEKQLNKISNNITKAFEDINTQGEIVSMVISRKLQGEIFDYNSKTGMITTGAGTTKAKDILEYIKEKERKQKLYKEHKNKARRFLRKSREDDTYINPMGALFIGLISIPIIGIATVMGLGAAIMKNNTEEK